MKVPNPQIRKSTKTDWNRIVDNGWRIAGVAWQGYQEHGLGVVFVRGFREPVYIPTGVLQREVRVAPEALDLVQLLLDYTDIYEPESDAVVACVAPTKGVAVEVIGFSMPLPTYYDLWVSHQGPEISVLYLN